MSSLKLVTAPVEEAVALQELKAHLNSLVTSTEDEAADLSLKLSAACAWVEGELGRCLVTSTYDLRLDCWPCRPYIDIPLGNLQTVTWIKYTDAAGTEHTLDSSKYKTARSYSAEDGALDAGIGRVYLGYAQLWPSVVLDTGEPVVIRFTCGWADAASVPLQIKQAILMVAAHWYRNRDAVVVGDNGAVSNEVALGAARLISIYEDRQF